MSEKIKPHHVERKAILYVRQSSAYQVNNNLESQTAIRYGGTTAKPPLARGGDCRRRFGPICFGKCDEGWIRADGHRGLPGADRRGSGQRSVAIRQEQS